MRELSYLRQGLCVSQSCANGRVDMSTNGDTARRIYSANCTRGDTCAAEFALRLSGHFATGGRFSRQQFNTTAFMYSTERSGTDEHRCSASGNIR